MVKVYVKLCYRKLFNTLKLLFTNKDGNVIAGIKSTGLKFELEVKI